MWTMFVNKDFPCQNDTFDFIYVEANKFCSKMFLDHLYKKQYSDKYYLSHHKNPMPSITNVESYCMYDHDIEIKIRVICVDELIELGCIYSNGINKLIQF